MSIEGLFSIQTIYDVTICAMVKSRYIGDGHPTFNRNPYNGYINSYYWVDEFIPYYMEIMGVKILAHILFLCQPKRGGKYPGRHQNGALRGRHQNVMLSYMLEDLECSLIRPLENYST